MVVVEKSALVLFSDEQMFTLVNDIEAYPSFLAGCLAAELHHRSDEEILASLTLGKGGVNFTFKTRNQLEFPSAMIMQLESGPFKALTGTWRFNQLGDLGCKVALDLRFEPENKVMGMAINPLMTQMAGQMVSAFCERANELYG